MTEDDIAREFAKKLESSLFETLTGPQRRQPQTALRARGNGFEVVELDSSGNIIEPVRCRCGSYAVFHRSDCPFAYTVS